MQTTKIYLYSCIITAKITHWLSNHAILQIKILFCGNITSLWSRKFETEFYKKWTFVMLIIIHQFLSVDPDPLIFSINFVLFLVLTLNADLQFFPLLLIHFFHWFLLIKFIHDFLLINWTFYYFSAVTLDPLIVYILVFIYLIILLWGNN